MSREPFRCVVDASVAIKLFVQEPLSEVAGDLFQKLVSEPFADEPPAEFHVPDLFYIECTNILLKYIRRFHRPIEDSIADLADLGLLSLKSVPTAEIIQDALRLAVEKNITAYDACYATLARRLGVPLVTADEPMARAVEWAVHLGDLREG